MLKINKDVFEAIIEHGKQELPHEACGYLASDNKSIVLSYALTNLDKAADHFTMDLNEQFAASKDMRAKGLKLAAVYHSHPNTPARPSAEDIRLAHDPNISYVIVSLAEKECTVKSFLIHKGEVSHEKIEITD